MKNIVRISCFSVFIFAVLLSKSVDGQKVQNIKYIDSISLGLSYADTGAYAKAAAIFERVPPGDTNYTLALLEDAVAKESLGQDSAAIAICYKGLRQDTGYKPDFYNVLANTFIDEGRDSNAVKLLQDTVLPKCANNHKLYCMLGIAQYKMNKYSDAINSFEKSIDLDIYDALSHYYLGRCCMEQGRLIPALLSLQFYLVIQPQSGRSYTAVGMIQEMTENKYQYDKSYAVGFSQYHDSAFAELDLLIRSKIAINKQYKPTTKINYMFVKQIQLFCEQLKYVPNTGNYWMEKYVPFFVGLQQKKYLEPYLYFIISSVNDPKIQNGIIKNRNKLKKFAKWADGAIIAESSVSKTTETTKK